MTVIYDEARRVTTPVMACRSCGKSIYFSLTLRGKRAPFEVDDDGKATRVNHFINCPDAKRWSRP